MDLKNRRSSDRVSLELTIEILATDAAGREFFDEGRTILVSRHGAKILFGRKLVPHQEITIRCIDSGQEAVGRVVGQTGGGPEEGYQYGILLTDPDANPWGIDFPVKAEPEDAVGRTVMECMACHKRELAYLDEYELEVLEANRSLSRFCSRCSDTTVWKKSFGEAPEAEAPSPPLPPPTQEKRHDPRHELRVQVCIRSPQLGEEIVTTRNVSRGGVGFESPKQYAVGSLVEVAVPYSQGGGNIFVPGKVAHSRSLPSGQGNMYGVAYTRGRNE